MYLGYSAAAIATMAAGYFMTKGGISALALSQEDLEKIGLGVMKGALHSENFDHFLACVDSPKDVMAKLEDAVKDFQDDSVTGVSKALFKIGDAVSDVAKGIQTCDKDVSAREMQILSEMYEGFRHPKALAQRAGENIIVNGVEIYKEMSAAYTNYQEHNFEGFGRDVGIAMSLVFIGAGDSHASNGARQHAMKLVEAELYPEEDHLGDNSQYIAFLDTILTEREQARAAGDDDYGVIASMEGRNPTTFDGETFYDAEEFASFLAIESVDQTNLY